MVGSPTSERYYRKVFCVMLALAIIAFVGFPAHRWLRNSGRLPTPPGPKGLPLIGNALQMPSEYPWLAFAKLAREYGQSMLTSFFATLS